nr:GGDEF domain-containing protein [Gammaproteobacteria bacterium]
MSHTGTPLLSRTIASTATMRLVHPPMLDLLYTPLEERFERITRIARRALDVPVAAITLLSAEKQWFKSVAGWAVSELPADLSLCRLTLEDGGTVIIPDTRNDPRTSGHPLVVSRPKFRFYAGHALADGTGISAGTFCVFDLRPRRFTEADLACFRDLAALAARELADEHLRGAHAALTAKLGLARRQAMMDSLTRLWNRHGAMTLLQAALEHADRTRTPIGIALLDLDNFKYINDTFGHQTGDEVLRRIGERLVASVRGSDIVARLGGDEFLVIVDSADEATTSSIIQRALDALARSPLTTRDGPIRVAASAGHTVRKPGERASIEDLLERADRQLLESKSAGRRRAVSR